MNFIQNLDTVFPINAYNDNIVRFQQFSAVRALILVSFAGGFEITSNNGFFYFNFKEIFKTVINQNLFSDTYREYQNIERDDDALKWINVVYRTFSSTGSLLGTEHFTYKVSRGVTQIQQRISQRNFLHHVYNNEVFFDVFEGFPFELSYYHQETSKNNITITSKYSSVNFELFSQNEDVYRIPLIDLNGHILHQYAKSNYLSFTEGFVSTFLFVSDKYAQAVAKINYHRKCKGVYLKWINTYGGWDYWLFSDKHKIYPKDRISGKVYTGFDNIENLESIESSLGKSVSIPYDLTTAFLNRNQFSKVLRIMYSPKVYWWINNKWVEVFITNKTKFNGNMPKGEIKLKMDLPKQFVQTA